MKMNEILAHFAIKYNGDWNAIYGAICNKEKVSVEDVKTSLGRYNKFITILDDAYPSHLKREYKPPLVIFYKGAYPTKQQLDSTHGGIGAYFFDNSTQREERLYCGFVEDMQTKKRKIIYEKMPSKKEFISACYSNGYRHISSHWVKKGSAEYMDWFLERSM